jgi:diadenosine tetraphosphate (Ap4A) HIT family hydrolase
MEQNASMMIVRNKFPYELWDFGEVADHLMLIPKRHVHSLVEMSDAEKLDYINMLGEWEEKGYNVYARTDLNKIAKSVAHQHTHLIKTTGTRRKFVIYANKPYFLWHR